MHKLSTHVFILSPRNCGIVKVPDLSVSFVAHVNFLLHFGILAESPLSSIDSIRWNLHICVTCKCKFFTKQLDVESVK